MDETHWKRLIEVDVMAHRLSNKNRLMDWQKAQLFNQLVYRHEVYKIFKDLSLEEQELAISLNGLCIQYIKNPTEAMKLTAVRSNGMSLRFIENPTEEMCTIAILSEAQSFRYVKNPTREQQLLAIQRNGCCIRFIKDPDNELLLIAARSNGMSLKYIKNPSKELQKIALHNNGNAIEFIEDPDEELQLIAVRQGGSGMKCNGMAITHVKNPTVKVLKETILKNPAMVRYMSNLSEEMQLFAINAQPWVAQYITGLTEKATELAQKLQNQKIYMRLDNDKFKNNAILSLNDAAKDLLKDPSYDLKEETCT